MRLRISERLTSINLLFRNDEMLALESAYTHRKLEGELFDDYLRRILLSQKEIS